MTESEMDKLAEMVVDKIISRQKAYDEEFKAEIQDMVADNENLEFGTITEDEIVADEIIKLNNRLEQLEKNEDYEAARIVANKIKHLKNKYNL
jgi:protein-arginine kinase activator protein McsA|tara:strand:- start:207 stop:485 length:279 start_codon:yes stop_codon:yes gene_type:complete